MPVLDIVTIKCALDAITEELLWQLFASAVWYCQLSLTDEILYEFVIGESNVVFEGESGIVFKGGDWDW